MNETLDMNDFDIAIDRDIDDLEALTKLCRGMQVGEILAVVMFAIAIISLLVLPQNHDISGRLQLSMTIGLLVPWALFPLLLVHKLVHRYSLTHHVKNLRQYVIREREKLAIRSSIENENRFEAGAKRIQKALRRLNRAAGPFLTHGTMGRKFALILSVCLCSMSLFYLHFLKNVVMVG